ncbi:MAG: hypothetical protein KC713_04280 [Candidatus Omnitrophica bacterium]|nr:hypothetical protein [Candidatus Omnitrophota bacterium]
MTKIRQLAIIEPMKILKVIILLIITFSFLPLDGFCEDHHSGDGQEHHCVLACHICHHLVSPETVIGVSRHDLSQQFTFKDTFHYQAPILEQTHRPPIATL